MKRAAQFATGTTGLMTAVVAHAQSAGPTARSTDWTWPAYIIVPLIALGLAYVIGLTRMRAHRAPLNKLQIAAFASGWISLLLALDSPIHEISEQLFWVHMTQHEILMLISAPLLVLSQPLAVFLWAIPAKQRGAVASLAKTNLLRRIWVVISAPVAAWLLHALALWLWHAPVLFVAALETDFAHAIQHLSFLGSALVFWWALVHNQAGRLGYGGAVLYVFTTIVHTSVLGAWLTFSPHIWYAPYAQTAPVWGLTAIEDQQLGGLIMWIPAGTLLTIAALVLFAKWLRHSERRWQYTHTAALIRASQGAGR
jgi:putative membrane protein